MVLKKGNCFKVLCLKKRFIGSVVVKRRIFIGGGVIEKGDLLEVVLLKKETYWRWCF